MLDRFSRTRAGTSQTHCTIPVRVDDVSAAQRPSGKMAQTLDARAITAAAAIVSAENRDAIIRHEVVILVRTNL
jgi:hypothetical protein